MNQKELIEKLLQLFSKSDNVLKLNEIAKSLSIPSDTPEYLLLQSVLNELCSQNIIQKSTRRRYSLNNYENITTFEGIINIKGDAGFVNISMPTPMKVRIKKRHLNTAFDGDSVLIRLVGAYKKNRKPRGEVVKILERKQSEIKGKIEFYDNIFFFIPADEMYYVDFIISSNKLKGAKDGDKVKVKLLYWDNPMKSPQAEVIEVLDSTKVKNEILEEFDSIIDEFNLPYDFDDKVNAEADAIAKPDIKQLVKERLDLRKEIIITIDPIDAKDFDDALSLTMLDNGNRLLGVHIADVSYYVRPNTLLDKEALNRGNSVYLVDRVVPMLPEALSNELCSLKPNRIRLAYTVLMEITPAGVVKDYKINESIIKSSRRFTYEEVQEIIDTGKGDFNELVLQLHSLASQLRENRFRLGGVDFESIEIKFKLDEHKIPIEAEPRKSTPATQLVEECMLLANKTVALHIRKISVKNKILPDLPFLYRVHDEPLPDKLNENLEFLKTLGVKFSLKNHSSKEINRIVKLFEGRPEKPIVHQIMLRSMAKAEYSGKNIGHFGLGFTDYAHFTSPIRRYPDLVVHRLLKDYSKKIPDKKKIDLLTSQIENIGKHCTGIESESMGAERACVKLAQTYLARKYLGREMSGVITGVTNFGIFVMLDEFYGEGLLHARDMRDDYYYFDEKNHRMIGKRNKKMYKFGDKINVRIIHVNIETRKIELNLP
jgi:ribonuclease R